MRTGRNCTTPSFSLSRIVLLIGIVLVDRDRSHVRCSFVLPTVVVTSRGADRVKSGHPWIYRSDVVDARASAGDRVAVVGARGRPIGRALYSDRSQIAVRMLTRGETEAGDDL